MGSSAKIASKETYIVLHSIFRKEKSAENRIFDREIKKIACQQDSFRNLLGVINGKLIEHPGLREVKIVKCHMWDVKCHMWSLKLET